VLIISLGCFFIVGFTLVEKFLSHENYSSVSEKKALFPTIPWGCGKYFNDEELPLQTEIPAASLIHIPKTGGTSIEEELAAKNISVGRFEGRMRYKTEGINCSRWHKPPVHTVPNSITVVRDPLLRLESEFKYCYPIDKFRCNLFDFGSVGFEEWVQYTLTRAKYERSLYDCHLIPQWEYAKWATKIIPLRCLSEHQTWEYLGKFFNSSKLTVQTRMVSSKSNISLAHNISRNTYQLVKEFYSADYANMSQYF